MLVAFSAGLWVFALFWDLVRASGGGAAWSTAALYVIAGVEAVEKLAKKKKDKEQPRLRRAR